MKLNSGRLWLKTFVYGALTLCVLSTCALILFYQRFDAQAVRHNIVNEFAQRGYDAEINGNISPHFFPYPGLDIERIAVYPAGTRTALLTLNKLNLDLAWWPLLQKQHELRSLAADGMTLTLRQQSDGTLNIDGLLQKNRATSLKLQLDRFALRNANIDFTDEISGHTAALRDAQLELVDMASAAHLQLDGKLLEGKREFKIALSVPYHHSADKIAARDISANLTGSGRNSGTSLSATGNLDINTATLQTTAKALQIKLNSTQAKLQLEANIPHASANPAEVLIPYATGSGEFNYAQTRYRFNGALDQLKLTPAGLYATQISSELISSQGPHSIKIKLSAPLQLAGLNTLRMDPLKLDARLITPVLPRGQLFAALDGTLSGELDSSRLTLRVAGKLDGTQLALALDQTGFIDPHHEAALSIDQLDLNRYLPETKPEQAVALFQNTAPLQLDWMDFLHLKGKVDIGELNMGRFRVRDINAHVEADRNAFAVDNLSASIYEGKLSGSARLQRGKEATLSLKQQLHGMHIRPLLLDLFNFSRIEGKGSGEVNLVAHGKSLAGLRDTLTGQASVKLAQGALTGIDLVAALKNLPAELKDWSATSLATDQKQKTTFQSLSASFDLDNGIARNQDLQLASQLVNVHGNGKLDLPQSIIDYTLDVKANPRSFKQLGGVNVPLKITGQINAPIYALDFNAMVKGKTSPDEKQQALKQELKKQITTILP
ncbi:AsmA family protein [Craterilacuibacter sp. RT1T]|uniref:AsmA family protein n=1 Tax=Craterilacuibacter sp. RT1T TaxID=2942211 RepID=UPI0020BE18F8|nr:AsmA family protein [Craterilacuibacter sp. RT1T]MCL6263870.1 AsmA family protein [Craterilacuibacter sp. RT1T]